MAPYPFIILPESEDRKALLYALDAIGIKAMHCGGTAPEIAWRTYRAELDRHVMRLKMADSGYLRVSFDEEGDRFPYERCVPVNSIAHFVAYSRRFPLRRGLIVPEPQVAYIGAAPLVR